MESIRTGLNCLSNKPYEDISFGLSIILTDIRGIVIPSKEGWLSITKSVLLQLCIS